jgi:hypothetical protein
MRTSDEAARQSRRDDELDYLEKGVRLLNMMAGVRRLGYAPKLYPSL